jgi:hypothetical protein
VDKPQAFCHDKDLFVEEKLMTSKKPVLFLSYTRLIMHFVWGWIDKEDLRNGLYYLDCTSEYAFVLNDKVLGEIAWWKRIDPNIDARKLFSQVRNALELSQAHGRVEWRDLYAFERPLVHKAIIPDLSGKTDKRAQDKKEIVFGAKMGCNHQLDAFLVQNGVPSQLHELEHRFARNLRTPAWGAKNIYERPLSTFEWHWLLERKQKLLRVIW